MSGKSPDSDIEFVRQIEKMLGMPNYLLPLSAAQAQMREFFEGMTAAALLEVVWCWALARFQRDHDDSGSSLIRARSRRQAEWDYEVFNNKYSHKTGRDGPADTAIVWDATKTDTDWSAVYPIVFQSGNHSPRTASTQSFGKPIGLRALDGDADYLLKEQRTIVMVDWPVGQDVTVLHRWDLDIDKKLQDLCSAPKLYELLTDSKCPANHIELLGTTRRLTKQEIENDVLAVGSKFRIDSGLRPGIYLIKADQMKNVSVATNNRGLLAGKKDVESWLKGAEDKRRFVPMPMWWGSVASRTPPDLFLPQILDFNSTVPLMM